MASLALLKGLPLAGSARLGPASLAPGAGDTSCLAADVAVDDRAALFRFELLQTGTRGGVVRLNLQHVAQAIGTLSVVLDCSGKPQPRRSVERIARDRFREQSARGFSAAFFECNDAQCGEIGGGQS
jgi:hypothetical protein